MRRIALRLTGLAGLMLLLTGCDKCGDMVQFVAPSLPHSCTQNAPAQK